MAGVKEISQIFRVTPRQGERRSPAECSRKNIQIPGKLRPGRKYGRRMFRQKVSPLRKAPRTRQKEKSPEKIWQEEGKFPSMACALPFPLRSRNIPGREECAEQVSAGKRLPQEKSLLRNMPLHRRPQRKNLHRPLTSCRSARNARVCRKRTAEYRWRKPSFSPENRKRSDGSPTAQGKNWLWKRKLTRCAGSPTTPERKNVLPVPHGRSEGDFPSFCVMPPAGGAPKSGRLFRQTHSAPGETPPRQEIDRPHLPAGKFTPQESPQDKPGEGKFPSGGCARPSLCSKSLRPGLRPHDRKPTPPPAGTPTEALRPEVYGKQILPFPSEKHVPPGSEYRMCRPPM